MLKQIMQMTPAEFSDVLREAWNSPNLDCSMPADVAAGYIQCHIAMSEEDEKRGLPSRYADFPWWRKTIVHYLEWKWGILETHPRIRRIYNPFASAWSVVSFVFSKLACDVFDHDWVDESYGNPDSGGIGGYCRRCHDGFWEQLY